jgi:hypothetical protein
MSPSLFIPAAVVAIVAAAVPAVRADQISEKIDALIEEGYKAHKITPNGPTTDEAFVRRIYLDVIGRIPSQEEARGFLDSTEAGKRSKLIDRLLDSEGYVSNWYNWWADILRMETGMRGEAGQAYAAWVKDSLRNNKPYDQFVRELITAEGYVWDNGAVGYYLRDAGMPLDNMSNTTQIFLGTRLACAQCHNHPFDHWTQKDYYEMAAFTYGTDPKAIANKGIEKDMNDALDSLKPKERRGSQRDRDTSDDRMKQSMRRIVEAIFEPMKNGVKDDNSDTVKGNEKVLKLPADYKYADGSPNEVVKPHVIFGKEVTSKQQARTEYAKWMANPENPRFTLVMANRLWKRVMGMGLIEPVDDVKDDTVATNQPLMKYLTQQFVYSKYDMKKMLRAFYNTKTYQRQTTVGDVPEDKPYYYPGPVMRRMSAEQIWDSICTLVIPEPDMRLRGAAYKATLESMRKEAEALEKAQKTDIITVAKKYAQQDFDLEMKGNLERDKLNKAREAADAKATQAAQKELNTIKTSRDALAAMARSELLKTAGEKSKGGFVTAIAPPGMTKKKEGKAEPAMDAQNYRQWDGYGDEFYRASELPSPAPNGHFLREFGQSNRQIIENSTREATVSQALSLMNGPLFDKITMEKTQFMQRFQGASTDEGRINAIFYGLFARKATDQEKAIVLETVAAKGKDGWKTVIWALLNTREFVFVQ